MSEPTSRESLSPAVTSSVHILDLLASAGEPMSGAEIARSIGRAKSTVSNILTALEQASMIEKFGTGYLLGRKLVELGGAYLAQTDLVSTFHRSCRAQPVAKDETLSLSSLQGSEILYLAHHNGTQPVRWFANVGARLPVIDTAMGIAMLSTLDDAELDDFLRNDARFEIPTDFAYRNEVEVRKAVEEARDQGYAIGDQLNTLGLCSLACPVHSRFDNRKLAIGVTMLSARRDPALESALLEDLQALAASLPPATD